MKKLLCVVILICLAAGALSGCVSPNPPQPEEPEPKELLVGNVETLPPSNITLENYEKLKIGMSYAEACSILGDNAEELYLHEIFGYESLYVEGYGCENFPNSDVDSSPVSVWSIKRTLGFFKGVILSFKNNKLEWKANHNLDGKYSNIVKAKDIGYEAFCSLGAFMSLKTVSGIIGGYLAFYYEVETASGTATIFRAENSAADLSEPFVWLKFLNNELVCVIRLGGSAFKDKMTVISDKQLASVKDGITYEELCRLFNSKGVLEYVYWGRNRATSEYYDWLYKTESGDTETYVFTFFNGRLIKAWEDFLGGYGSI